VSWYFAVLKNYVGFTGRARRREYWMFFLVSLVITWLIDLVDLAVHTSIPGTLYMFATTLPALAAGVRRMHDTDHSGWWVLCPVVNIIFLCIDGTPGDNRFGRSPKVALAHA
jgi:uncharacterized membrane protein YhaH (DUF805 family)